MGGKSPCIVDEKCNVELAAKRIAYGKILNSGQTCVAPDYVFVHQNVKEQFLNCLEIRTEAVKMYIEKIILEESPTNIYDDIIGSVIHLHCNRLFGINREFEQKIMNYAYRTLHGQKYLRKQMLNNESNKKD